MQIWEPKKKKKKERKKEKKVRKKMTLIFQNFWLVGKGQTNNFFFLKPYHGYK